MARVATVNAHGGNAGLHKVLYKKYLLALKDNKAITAAMIAGLSFEEERALMKDLEDEAMESSCKEFKSCLLLLMGDGERYNPLKLHLANEHLTKEGVYPSKSAEMKRLIGNFDAPGVKTPVRAAPQLAGGLAFVEARPFTGQCFHCGKTGHRASKCPSATQAQKDATYKNGGKSRKGGGGDDDNKSTPGKIHAAVKDKSKSRSSSSSGSKPTYAELLQFQKLVQGSFNVNVGKEYEEA